MGQKILLLEDDEQLSEVISEIISEEGYEVTVVFDGQEAADILFIDEFDLYVFDINVPEMDGLELLERLRFIEDNTPTIIISALIDLPTIQKAFKVGADNYLKKPFYPEELILYINNKLKPKIDNIIKINDMEYNFTNKTLIKNGEIVSIGKVQTKLLEKLLNNIGNVVEKETLLNCLDKHSEFGLRTSINKLKKNTGLNIKSIRGIGYLIDNVKS